jgi:hypothetical protein
VLGASDAVGVNVATVAPAFNATVPGTEVAPAATWMLVEPAFTARSKPADTVVFSATFVALVPGVRVVTAGAGWVVVNDHDSGVIEAPAEFVAPETVTE